MVSTILSSRSLIHSSASIILLLISSNYHSSLFFSFSRSLVDISFILPLLFPRSWIICTIHYFWILFLQSCYLHFHLVVFWGFYLVLSLRDNLLLFILINFLWLWFSFWRLWDIDSSICLLVDEADEDWQWEKQVIVLVGRVLLSKALICWWVGLHSLLVSCLGWGNPALVQALW